MTTFLSEKLLDVASTFVKVTLFLMFIGAVKYATYTAIDGVCMGVAKLKSISLSFPLLAKTFS